MKIGALFAECPGFIYLLILGVSGVLGPALAVFGRTLSFGSVILGVVGALVVSLFSHLYPTFRDYYLFISQNNTIAD